MFWFTLFSFMMMTVVNGVYKGTSFLFAKLWASGPDEMTMWWLSARCCHFSHDFLMLFSHGSPPWNNKQMPNAFMDVFSYPLILSLSNSTLFSTSPPLTSPASFHFKLHSYFFLLLYSLTALSFRFFFCLPLCSCRCCVWSRLQWPWSCLRSRMPPLPLPL